MEHMNITQYADIIYYGGLGTILLVGYLTRDYIYKLQAKYEEKLEAQTTC